MKKQKNKNTEKLKYVYFKWTFMIIDRANNLECFPNNSSKAKKKKRE